MGDGSAIRFDCTMCGKCCHGLRLPVSIAEAVSWLERGGRVELLVDAAPQAGEGADDAAQYRRARSFAAACGAMPVSVRVTLVATFEGACPFLLPDMRCGGYEHRPRTCRIYPAEVNPFVTLAPEGKSCPSEAWGPPHPIFYEGGAVVDTETRALIAAARASAVADVPAKARLCAALGVREAALANEGFVVVRPEPARLLAALRADAGDSAEDAWAIVSNRRETLDLLGADGVRAAENPRYAYLALHPDS